MLPEAKEGNSRDCLGVLVRHQLCSSALLLKLFAEGVPGGSCKGNIMSMKTRIKDEERNALRVFTSWHAVESNQVATFESCFNWHRPMRQALGDV